MNRLLALGKWGAPFLLPRLTRADLWLLGATLGLVGFGIVMVFNVSYFRAQDLYGAPYAFFFKHVAAAAAGGVLLVAVSRVRPELFERWAGTLYLIGLGLLVLVLIPGIGVARGGARRWLPFPGFSLQPAELVKITTVIYLARWISRRQDRMHHFASGILPALVSVGCVAALMVLQPDFGTAAIIGAVLLLMLFVGGARPIHIAGLGAIALVVLSVGVMLAEYRMRRFLAFLDPWQHSQDSAFQLVQSLIAFGSGGITGVGLGQSRQKLFFLPEAHTDFIFALIGEELGLWGALLVLVLFGILGMRGFRVASRHPDPFASALAFGLTLVILLEAVVNVGVVVGLLPTKGLALPVLSYGGSALIGTLLQVGMLAALSRMTG